MRKINPKSNNIDSFKYSILILLHYYDTSHHREKTTKLDKYVNNYNFSDTNPEIFEKDNLHISLKIFDENNKKIYNTNNNNSINKAYTVKINDYRYAAIKTSPNNLIKSKQLVKKMSHIELEQILIHIIKYFEYYQLRKALTYIVKSNILPIS